MEVTMKRVNDAVLLEARSADGSRISIDGSEEAGGVGGGFRPMELLLAGIGGCSAIDIINILKKQRQTLSDFSVRISGERESGKIPSVFTDIHLHYTLSGELDKKKVERALELGVRKYCSVGEMLEKTSKVTYSYEMK